MDETVIVIMLRDKETGFLDKELGCYKIENENLIYNTYAQEENDTYVVYLKLTCDRELEDWEFEAVYDYYDTETILPFVTSIQEDQDCYNPTWIVTINFEESVEGMEEKIGRLLLAHKKELCSVYEAIADKRDDYINNEE